MKPRTVSDVAELFPLLGSPAYARILLELGEGPRDTTTLAAAVVGSPSTTSTRLTMLRLAGLVETTASGLYRVHVLTPSGRQLAGAIRKLSAD
jgi:DNA-binding transcriptional ArsR family regulator